MLPNFLILGAQKSASTFIQDCLSEHPEVFMPENETPFFESPDYENGELIELESLFDGRGERLLGIKRPAYLAKPEVPERIAQHIPDAKLVAILRNPLERSISAYYHNMRYGFIPPRNIEAGLRDIITGKYEFDYPRSGEIIEFGRYHKHLQRYTKHFGKEQILILFHEDILNDKLGEVRKTYRFLGVDESFVPKALNSRPQAVLYSLTRLRLLALRNRFTYSYSKTRTRVYLKKMNRLEALITRLIVDCCPNYLKAGNHS